VSGSIYVEQSQGEPLVEMTQLRYESEDRLQAFLETHPSLLGGEQMDSAAPRRWLLVSREMGVPGEERGAGRWSLDHLFLDQDAIPTLVEVKRSTDTRIRREVVGQMLDYAANGVAYWRPGTLRTAFVNMYASRKPSRSADEALLAFLEPGVSPDDFWQGAERNLAQGKLRLLFVADQIPAELRRIVEFLNSQMDRTEVLAVEIAQYQGGGLSALVPRVIGQTTESQQRPKAKDEKRPKLWDLPMLLGDLRENFGAEVGEVAREIHDATLRRGNSVEIRWGRGARVGNFSINYWIDGVRRPLAFVETNGRLTGIDVGKLYSHAAFAKPPMRAELDRRLSLLPGLAEQLRSGRLSPYIPLRDLQSESALKQFWDLVDWALKEVDLASGPAPSEAAVEAG
jgi:hypothetical protein